MSKENKRVFIIIIIIFTVIFFFILINVEMNREVTKPLTKKVDETIEKDVEEEKITEKEKNVEEQIQAGIELNEKIDDAREIGLVKGTALTGIEDEILIVRVDSTEWANTPYDVKIAFITVIGKLNQKSGKWSIQVRDYFSNEELGDFSPIRGPRIFNN